MKTTTAAIRLTTNSDVDASGCVNALENMLELAKSGQITSVAVAAVYRDGGIGTCFEKGDRATTLLAAVSHLQYRLHVDFEN